MSENGESSETRFDMTQYQRPHGDEGYNITAKMNVEHRPYIAYALEQAEGADPKTILDIGYGGGIVSRLTLRKFPKAVGYGIDISEVSYNTAMEYDRYFIDEGRLKLIIGDVHDMPYEDGKFDFVISSESYFFWEDIKAAWKEVVRVMAKGAMIVIPAGVRIDESNAEELRRKWPAPMHIYLDSEMVSMLTEAGLDAKMVFDDEKGMGAFIGVKK